jgi:mono/diheme cytochrome c family protein
MSEKCVSLPTAMRIQFGAKKVMKALLSFIFGSLILTLGFGVDNAVQSQTKQPPARGFDYWQSDWMVRELWGPGRIPKGMMVRLLRHTVYMQYGVPKKYAEAKSAARAGPKSISDGGKLYATYCAACHGRDGMGSGDPGKAVSPSPALLAYMIRRPISVDEYLLWCIADGGAQFETKMPAFKDKLSREDIWRIIAYMRAGFPHAKGRPK